MTMTTELETYTISELLEGFLYNDSLEKGLYGLDGRLTIQAEYQRNYLYGAGDGSREARVIDSVMREYPLGIIYFNTTGHNSTGGETFEILDGQQRITSLGRFKTGKFGIEIDNDLYFYSSLPDELRERFDNTQILVYHCSGTEQEVMDWFSRLNIVGMPLTDQELLNAVYHGEFVSHARSVLSNPADNRMNKWRPLVSGDPSRQELMATALQWIAAVRDTTVEGYMAQHRTDSNADELIQHFTTVLDWAFSTFNRQPDKEMARIDWNRLYTKFGSLPYGKAAMKTTVDDLRGDPAVKKAAGIYEYALQLHSASIDPDPKLLEIRVFDDITKRATYKSQTAIATAAGVSNCSYCAAGSGAKAEKIYTIKEMEADHVTAWSLGGATTAANCEMLCVPHNRAKGNR